MKKLAQRLTVIAFGIGLTSAAVIYFTHSEPKASAQSSKGEKRDVPYMDSSAIAVLVESLQKLRKDKGGVYLTDLQPRVKGLLEIARLETIFNIRTDESDAIAR